MKRTVRNSPPIQSVLLAIVGLIHRPIVKLSGRLTLVLSRLNQR